MKLADYQRAVLRLSLSEQGQDETASPELPRFALYRHMIRARFVTMAQVAFRRSWQLIGEAAMTRSFDRYLAAGPQSPILRSVIADFAEFLPRDRPLSTLQHDLVRFEAAKWRVASAEHPELAVREVDFDGVLVLNPTLAQLALEHDVSEHEDSTHDPHVLWMYRRPHEDDVRWYRAPSLLRELLSLPGQGELRLGELVQTLFASRGPAVDAQALLEELAAALTIAVERGVLWGVRDESEAPSSLA